MKLAEASRRGETFFPCDGSVASSRWLAPKRGNRAAGGCAGAPSVRGRGFHKASPCIKLAKASRRGETFFPCDGSVASSRWLAPKRGNRAAGGCAGAPSVRGRGFHKASPCIKLAKASAGETPLAPGDREGRSYSFNSGRHRYPGFLRRRRTSPTRRGW